MATTESVMQVLYRPLSENCTTDSEREKRMMMKTTMMMMTTTTMMVILGVVSRQPKVS
jgi:hypothetical protein